jgi:hypothetical protein
MKIVAGIFGILGALGGAFLGSKWLSDLGSPEGQAAEAVSEAAGISEQLAAMKSASYSLLACAVVGLVVSILVLRLKGNKVVNAALLIAAGALPMVFAQEAVFGVPMALAGLLAFGVNYAPSQQPKA